MRPYAVAKLATLVYDQLQAASTIPELKAALQAARNIIPHCQEHKLCDTANNLTYICDGAAQKLSRLQIEEEKRVIDEKIAERIAKERSPEWQIKRLHPKKTMLVTKQKPESLKHCVVTKINRRYELRWMSRETLLADALTHKELCDLKWFAQTHYSPINWIGDLPTR